ncbi:hypothetical protein KCP69_24875 [Salmonella enterica subsp. enterica]|nr:hypothetical protein KCP69_24875 [Salmonella enterica subsp. enterica]
MCWDVLRRTPLAVAAEVNPVGKRSPARQSWKRDALLTFLRPLFSDSLRRDKAYRWRNKTYVR